MQNFKSSFVVLCAFVIGASSSLLLPHLPSMPILLGLIAATFILALRLSIGRLLFVAALGFTIACTQFAQHQANTLAPELEGIDIEVIGQIRGLVRQQQSYSRFTFRIDSALLPSLTDNQGKQVLALGDVSLSCYRCQLDLYHGQRWRFLVRLKRPNSYASWGAFDYERYLFANRIVATGYLKQQKQSIYLAEPGWNPTRLRRTIRDRLDRLYPNHEVGAGIILALVSGDKSWLTTANKEVLQRTGTSHLMAISGLHVGLVFYVSALLCSLLIRLCPPLMWSRSRQQMALVPAMASAVFYAALAGFAITTQRALLMLMIFVLLKIFRRDTSLHLILLLTAAIIISFDAFALLQTGFWLSFCAVLAIATLHVNTEQPVRLWRLQLWIWLGTLPIVLFAFNSVSMVAPIVNLVVVPLFCMLLIPLTLFAVLMYFLGWSWLAEPLLNALVWAYGGVYQALDFIQEWPWATGAATPFTFYVVVILLLAFLMMRLFREARRWFAISALLLIISGLFHNATNEDDLIVTLLDVGQGLSLVIEHQGEVIVYDTGPRYASGFSTAEAVLLPYLRTKGIRRINTLFISHADNDHIGGYEVLRKQMPVRQIFTSRIDVLPEAQACENGLAWQQGQLKVHVLAPANDSPSGSNNKSCVVQLHYAGTRLLLSGDIEKATERWLLEKFGHLLESEILLVPHQGSKTSSESRFLDHVKPEVALLAAGYRNRYGHPHERVIERYNKRQIPVLSTIDNGSIQMRIDANGWKITAYRLSEARFWHRQIFAAQAGKMGALVR